MHPFKELQKLTPKYAKQLSRTLKALSKISENENPKKEAELIAKYEEEKKATDEMAKRFQELIELDKEG
ncbi:MAG: hypothetical protein GC171_02230 [Terrimonas sp.]|nr:hypothetical protein [Terrimonas sp.]